MIEAHFSWDELFCWFAVDAGLSTGDDLELITICVSRGNFPIMRWLGPLMYWCHRNSQSRLLRCRLIESNQSQSSLKSLHMGIIVMPWFCFFFGAIEMLLSVWWCKRQPWYLQLRIYLSPQFLHGAGVKWETTFGNNHINNNWWHFYRFSSQKKKREMKQQQRIFAIVSSRGSPSRIFFCVLLLTVWYTQAIFVWWREYGNP